MGQKRRRLGAGVSVFLDLEAEVSDAETQDDGDSMDDEDLGRQIQVSVDGSCGPDLPLNFKRSFHYR